MSVKECMFDIKVITKMSENFTKFEGLLLSHQLTDGNEICFTQCPNFSTLIWYITLL